MKQPQQAERLRQFTREAFAGRRMGLITRAIACVALLLSLTRIYEIQMKSGVRRSEDAPEERPFPGKSEGACTH